MTWPTFIDLDEGEGAIAAQPEPVRPHAATKSLSLPLENAQQNTKGGCVTERKVNYFPFLLPGRGRRRCFGFASAIVGGQSAIKHIFVNECGELGPETLPVRTITPTPDLRGFSKPASR